MSGNHRILPWHGVPRDEISWWPIVEKCKCKGCGLCVISCPADALAFDYELRIPFVHTLHRCIVGCSICAMLCPQEAVLLPNRNKIQSVISENELAHSSRQELRRQRKHFAGVLPEVIYPDDVGKDQN